MGGMGGETAPAEPPSAGGAETPPTTERLVRNDLDLILERNLFNDDEVLELSKGRNSLVEINNKLRDLIDK